MFVHGFLEDSSVFDGLSTRYARRGYRCLLVDMPYYTTESSENHPYFGYTMTGIADYLHEIVTHATLGGALTLVAHDFGVVYSRWLLAKYPADAGAIVQLDLGFGLNVGADDHEPIDFQTLKTLFSLGTIYQYYLIVLWLMNRTPVLSGALSLCQSRFPAWFQISGHVIRPESAYSYLYFHLFPFSRYLANRTGLTQFSLYPTWARYRPDVPTLFLYGTQGRALHGDDWTSSLNDRQDGSKSVALDTGHWVHLEKPEMVQIQMDTFLDRVLGQCPPISESGMDLIRR